MLTQTDHEPVQEIWAALKSLAVKKIIKPEGRTKTSLEANLTPEQVDRLSWKRCVTLQLGRELWIIAGHN